MFAALLQRGGEGKKGTFGQAVGREHVGHARFALGNGAGLIQRDDCGLAGFFQRTGGLKENAVFRAEAVAHHDGDRRRQTERARAADDQHRDAARQCETDGLAAQQPHGGGDDGNGDDGRHEHAGYPVGDLCNRRFRCGRVGNHLDDLGECRILADARCFAAQEAGLIGRRGGNAVADGLVHRNALACQCGFVHGAFAFQNHAVHRDVFTRTNDEYVAALHLRNRHGDFLTVAEKRRGLRGEFHQALERVGRLALGARLKHLADGD